MVYLGWLWTSFFTIALFFNMLMSYQTTLFIYTEVNIFRDAQKTELTALWMERWEHLAFYWSFILPLKLAWECASAWMTDDNPRQQVQGPVLVLVNGLVALIAVWMAAKQTEGTGGRKGFESVNWYLKTLTLTVWAFEFINLNSGDKSNLEMYFFILENWTNLDNLVYDIPSKSSSLLDKFNLINN